MHSIIFGMILSNMGRLRVLEIVAEKAPLSLPSPDFLFSLCLKGKTNIWRQASIRGDMSYLLSSLSIIYSLLALSRIYHMEFVKNFTPPDFQAKNFTPSISPNSNSFSKKTQK